MTVSNITTATKIFQKNLLRFDLDNDGIMSSPELGRYGDVLREEGLFASLGVDDDAFMLQLHHYDNQAIDVIHNGLAEDLEDGQNYMGEDVFERAILNDVLGKPSQPSLELLSESINSLDIFEQLDTVTSEMPLDSLLNLSTTTTTSTPSIIDKLLLAINSKDDIDANGIFRTLANILPAPKRQEISEVSQEISDGMIDHFNQGQVGNGWFLAAVNSFTQAAEGRTKLKKSMSTNADGSYNVKFASDPNFVFTVTREEIEERRRTAGVSYGDIDLQILELAYEKLQKSRMEDRGLPGIHIWEALSGEKLENSGDRPTREHAEALLKNITGGIGVTKGFGISFGSAIDPLTGEAVYYSDTEEGHRAGASFAVTSIDWNTGTISYENPWDTESTKTMSLEAFYELLEKGGGFNWTNNGQL